MHPPRRSPSRRRRTLNRLQISWFLPKPRRVFQKPHHWELRWTNFCNQHTCSCEINFWGDWFAKSCVHRSLAFAGFERWCTRHEEAQAGAVWLWRCSRYDSCRNQAEAFKSHITGKSGEQNFTASTCAHACAHIHQTNLWGHWFAKKKYTDLCHLQESKDDAFARKRQERVESARAWRNKVNKITCAKLHNFFICVAAPHFFPVLFLSFRNGKRI